MEGWEGNSHGGKTCWSPQPSSSLRFDPKPTKPNATHSDPTHPDPTPPTPNPPADHIGAQVDELIQWRGQPGVEDQRHQRRPAAPKPKAGVEALRVAHGGEADKVGERDELAECERDGDVVQLVVAQLCGGWGAGGSRWVGVSGSFGVVRFKISRCGLRGAGWSHGALRWR